MPVAIRCLVLALLLARMTGLNAKHLLQAQLSSRTPAVSTRQDIDNYLFDMEQQFKIDMNKEFIEEFIKRKRDAGILQTEIAGLGDPTISPGMEVSASDFFTFEGQTYAVVSLRTLNESYIGLVTGNASEGTLKIEHRASFSMQSFIDSQYSATFQPSLQHRVVEMKAYVYDGQVFIMSCLENSGTLLFMVSDPAASWTPKYQDSVLNQDEVASDFAFFEESGQLRVFVAVSHRRSGHDGHDVLPAHQSYVYRLSGGIKWLQMHTVATPQGATSVTTFTDQRWTYIVIGQASVQSLVYRHHWYTKELELFQYLQSQRAISVEAFFHDTQIYVLLVNAYGAPTIFWWTSDQLFKWQSLDVESESDQIMFGHVGILQSDESYIYIVTRNAVYFYTTFNSYSGHFSLSASQILLGSAAVQHIQALRVTAGSHWLLVSVRAADVVQWMVFPVLVRQANVVLTPPERDLLLDCLSQLDEALEALDRELDELLLLSVLVFVSNRGDLIRGDVHIASDLVIQGPADIHKLHISSSVPMELGSVDLGDIRHQMAQCNASIEALGRGLETALTASSPQTITGHYTFNNLVVEGTLSVSQVTRLETLDQFPWHGLLNSALTYSGDQLLRYPLNISSGSAVGVSLAATATLNGVTVPDLQYTSGSQIVTGRHRYQQVGISGDLWLSSLLNEVDLSTALLLGQTLTVPTASLHSASVDTLLVTSVNGTGLTAWQRHAVHLDRPQTFAGHFSIESATFVSLSIVELNRYHLSTVLQSLWKNDSDVVAGTTDFRGSVVVNQLTFDKINGVSLWTDVLTTDTDQTVTSQLQVDVLDVSLDLSNDQVNGLDLSVDVIRTSGVPSSVAGTVLFANDLIVTGHVLVEDGVTVNEVDISDVPALLSSLGAQHLSQDVVLNGLWTIQGSVHLTSVNGYRLDLLHQLFWTRDGDQDIPTPVTILNGFTVKGDMEVSTINDIDTDKFIYVSTGGTVQNDVSFEGNITASDVFLSPGGRLNGFDLSDFALTVVTRDGDQVILGTKTFSGGVNGSSVVVEVINDLRVPDDLLLVNGDQTQTGSLTFLEDLEVLKDVASYGDVTVTNAINAYRAADILDILTSMWVNSTFGQVLIINGNARFSDVHIMETLNTTGLTELLKGALQLDEHLYISGNFTVKGNVLFNSSLSLNTVNRLSWSDYLSSLTLSDIGGTVSGTTTLASSLTVTSPAHLLVTSLNGLMLSDLYNQFLTLHTDQVIGQRVTVNGFVRSDVMNVSAVNGVPADQLVFIDRDLHFYQGVHIFADVTTSELVITSGSLGNCNLTQVWNTGLRRTATTQTLTHGITVGSLAVNGDVTLSQSVFRDELQELVDRIVTDSGDHVITGEVVFQQPLFVTDAQVSLYNGVSVAALFEDALTYDGVAPVTLGPELTLRGGATLGDVTVTSDVAAGLVNGVDVSGWYADLVLLPADDVQLRGPLVLQQAAARNLLASGPVNDMPQPTFVEINDTITASVYFDGDLTVIDNLHVTGVVDGVNISSVLDQTVSLVKNDTIDSNVVFRGVVTVWLSMSAPQINGVHLSDLVLNHQLSSVQVISGSKHFETLHIGGNLCGLLNGVNMPTFCRGLLSSGSTGSSQLLSGHLRFITPPVNMQLPPGHLAENVTALRSLLVQQKASIAAWMTSIRTDIAGIRTKATSLTTDPDYSVDMAYLLAVQRLVVPYADSVHTSPVDSPSLHVLLRSPQGCELPADCLCRSTVIMEVHEGGLLSQASPAVRGHTWSFSVRETSQLLTVTATSDSYSPRCLAPESASLTVTSRSADQPAGAGESLPVVGLQSGYVSDVRVCSFHGGIFMMVGYGFGRGGAVGRYPATQVFALRQSVWRPVQTLAAQGVASLDVTLVDSVPHLLVVNRFSRQSLSLQGEVQLWAWDTDLDQFVELNVLYHADIQAVVFLHAHDKVFVVVADLDGLTVLEYSPPRRSYAVCQYLGEHGVTAVTSFVVGAESYLVVFSAKLNEIVVYLVTHQGGLQRHCWYPATSLRSLAVYTWRLQLYLAAVHEHGVIVYSVVVRGRLSLVTTSAARLPELN